MKSRAGFDPLNHVEQMASLITDVTGEKTERVVERLEEERRHPGCTVAADFKQHGGPRYEWGKHLEDFYSRTDAFIYELVVWNRNHLKRQLRRWTSRNMGRRKKRLDVLSIGDGLGFDCMYFYGKKHRVTYFELPGLSERFARKLFERSNAKIDVLTDPTAIPRESFDAITCFDVLEHVPDPPAMVRTLASYLRPGGILYVSAPFFMILPWYPTHLRTNRQFSGSLALYRQAGLQIVGGTLTWYPVALQKQPCENPVRPSFDVTLVRLTSVIQCIGRFLSWPFLPVHLLRRTCNRRFEERASNAS